MQQHRETSSGSVGEGTVLGASRAPPLDGGFRPHPPQQPVQQQQQQQRAQPPEPPAQSAEQPQPPAELPAEPQQTPECRICLAADDPAFVAPCKCRGTVQWAHLDCLKGWCSERASLRCEICKSRYREELLPELEPMVLAAQAQRRWQGQAAAAVTAAPDGGGSDAGEEESYCPTHGFWLRCLAVVAVLGLLLYFLLWLGTKAGDSAWAAMLLRILGFVLPTVLLIKAMMVGFNCFRRHQRLERLEAAEAAAAAQPAAPADAAAPAPPGEGQGSTQADAEAAEARRWWRWRSRQAGQPPAARQLAPDAAAAARV